MKTGPYQYYTPPSDPTHQSLVGMFKRNQYTRRFPYRLDIWEVANGGFYFQVRYETRALHSLSKETRSYPDKSRAVNAAFELLASWYGESRDMWREVPLHG